MIDLKATHGTAAEDVAAPALPYGGVKDETTPGAGDGTPVDKRMLDDFYQSLYAICGAGGVAPSNTSERANASDVLTALMNLRWVATVDFQVGARVMGSNGVVYRALQASGPNNTAAVNPVTDTDYSHWFPVNADGFGAAIYSATANDSATTLEIQQALPNFVRELEVIGFGFQPRDDDDFLGLQLYVGGAWRTAYEWGHLALRSNANGGEWSEEGSWPQAIGIDEDAPGQRSSNAAGEVRHFRAQISLPRDATIYPVVNYESWGINTGSWSMRVHGAGAYVAGTGAVEGVRVLYRDGSIIRRGAMEFRVR